MGSVLTFKALRDIQKKEKTTKQLQPLDSQFYSMVKDYLARKSRLSENGEIMTFTEARKFENARTIIRDIFNSRESKILKFAILNARTGLEPENLLPEEKILIGKVNGALVDFRTGFSDVLADNSNVDTSGAFPEEPMPKKEEKPEPEPEPEPKEENIESPAEAGADGGVTVKLLADVPAFVGPSGEKYGPFKNGEEARLPKKMADILMKGKRAESI